MKANVSNRSWVTPLSLGSFILCTVSGILLFFHVNLGLIKMAHQWVSWIFVIGVFLHMGLNWKPLRGTIVKPVGAFIVVVFLAITAVSFMPLVEPQQSPVKKAMAVVMDLPLQTLAQACGKSDEDLAAILAGHNINVADQSMSIRTLARQHQQNPVEVLLYLL